MNFMKHCFQLLLKPFVLSTLIEFANKMSTNLERVVGKVKRSSAKVLSFRQWIEV